MTARALRKITDTMAFWAKVFNKLRIMPISVFLFKFKDKIVLKWIYKNYYEFIENYKKPMSVEQKVKFEKLPIWVCWLQGEENAPILVKKCIASIRINSNGHKVIVVTEKNISDFVDIPEQIFEKVASGSLSRTHFSDILRFMLLSTYGGMWIDSTFFITKKLPESYFEYNLFSAAKQPEPKDRKNVCISRCRWTSSFLGANRNNHLLFCFLRDILLEYEKNNSVFIDYLLIDYFIYIAYTEFKEVRNDIDSIPVNNIDFGWLFHSMNKKLDTNEAKKMLFGETLAFKLSYKIKWRKQARGKITYFGKFIEDNIFID